MASSEIRTSTDNTLGGEYQVFLSFRGPDTRHGFTNCLYHALVDAGIRVFIDDEDLRPGETISGNLLQAIDNSKFYIPIFSKNYASSHWCLRELAKMVENTYESKGGDTKVILPIFYYVKPDDVKLKTTLYSKAISNLEKKMEDQKKKFSSKDVETWRQALKKVDDIKGWELEKYFGWGDLIKLVVHEVVVGLRTRQRRVTKDLVGMDDHIAAIDNLLDIDSGGVRLIVIYGMGGVGKTTLAEIIFNRLLPNFGKHRSFLDDVRETAKTKGLVKLQEQLLSNISHSGVAQDIWSIDHGINMIEETICNKKVLIVLDNVDEGNQIQELIGMSSLSSGTRILVTTRDKSILKIKGFKYEILPYEMEGLNEEDALQLFSRHAFGDSSPPADYSTLSKYVVSAMGGLPLALEAIGSLLFYYKEKTIWEEILKKLRETPLRDVLGKLKISYDALDMDQQQIFLDVACFYVGHKKIDPIYMWRDCGFRAEYAIHVLVDRCMIKVLNDDDLWMHELFRDLGRAIAKEQHTRLWDRDDIISKLRSPEIKESVQALRLPSRDLFKSPITPIPVASVQIKQFPHARFLSLHEEIFEADFTDFLSEFDLRLPSRDLFEPPITITSEQIKRFPHMRFLSLREVIFQGDFTGCLSELKWIILSYPFSYPVPLMATHRQWFEAIDSLHLENAVVVNLSGLDITEDVFEDLIKGARKLKVLTIQYNRSIHATPTFPEHSVLEKLTISKFLSLMKIDCSIGKLRWLTDLSFELCVELEKLPEQIGELRNLQHLSLRSCDSLSELPDSILKLESLTKLDLSCTRITRLPDSIGRLSRLSSIDVSFTPIEKLPSTMSKLLRLHTLRLNYCDGIQELPELPISLTTLQLTSTSLPTVPSLSFLPNLVELVLSDGSESKARSDKIQTCDLQWIGSLSKLSKLHFCFSNVCAPTTELGSLSPLEELTLHGLDVPNFEQLPSNLIVLELYDTRGKQVQLPSSEKEDLFVSPSSINSTEDKALRQIELEFFKQYGSSKRLARLREEPGCIELQAPELIDHWRGAFQFPSSLKRLQKFVLWGCPEVQDIQFVSPLKSLLEFSIGGCTSLKRLGGLSNLKNLMELTLERCVSLQVVEGIGKLEFLHQLRIDGCILLERIFDASTSKIPINCSILIT